MQILINKDLRNKLADMGVECLHQNNFHLHNSISFEPPCSIKWLQIDPHCSIGAFSYGVSGYIFGATIGRYCSFGENIQIGRQDHPTTWHSTSPIFYLNSPIFDVGNNFDGADDYQNYASHIVGEKCATRLSKTTIGNDVWIGHGAYIKAGVAIGDGAIIGAHSVVTKNIPAYSIAVGNPAVIKKLRFPIKTVEALKESNWWNYAPWQLNTLDFSDVDAFLKEFDLLKDQLTPYTPASINVNELQI